MRTLRCGWMRWEKGATPVRILQDSYGNVFARGTGGWMRPPEGSVVRLLPAVHDGTLASVVPDGDWWGRSWHTPTWAWIYMQQEKKP